MFRYFRLIGTAAVLYAFALGGCGYVDTVTDSVTDTMSGAVDMVDFWSEDDPAAANATVGARAPVDGESGGEPNSAQDAQAVAPLPLAPAQTSALQSAPPVGPAAPSAGHEQADEPRQGSQESIKGVASGQKYWYYPDDRVYYDPQRTLYFYWEKGDWVQSASLPDNIFKLLGDHVELIEDSDVPYERNRQHMNAYPPKQVRVRAPASGSW